MIHDNRFLLDPHAEDAQGYMIGGDGTITFVTGGVNGKTADETAIANLLDASEYTSRELYVQRLDPSMKILARARGGVGTRGSE